MDYSLLLAVEHLKTPRTDFFTSLNIKKPRDYNCKKVINQFSREKFLRSLMSSREGDSLLASQGTEKQNPLNQVYHFGIIDYLQRYNTNKRMESCWKHLRYGFKSEPSAVKPSRYRDRFIHFIRTKVLKV